MLEWRNSITAPYCVLEIPLLKDKESYLIDKVLCIQSDATHQKLRLKQRMLNESEIEGLLSMQIPLELRLKLADDVIDNNGSLQEFETKLLTLHQHYLKLSRAKGQKTS